MQKKKKVTVRKNVFLFFPKLFSKTFLIVRRTVIWSEMYIGLFVQYMLFLSDFNEINFLARFSNNTQT